MENRNEPKGSTNQELLQELEKALFNLDLGYMDGKYNSDLPTTLTRPYEIWWELHKLLGKLQDRSKEPRFLDVNGVPTNYSIFEINEMIRVLEDTGRYDVQGRRW